MQHSEDCTYKLADEHDDRIGKEAVTVYIYLQYHKKFFNTFYFVNESMWNKELALTLSSAFFPQVQVVL